MPTSTKLTKSQREALMVLAARHPDPAYPSAKNGPTCIATGSAKRLEDLGLAQASYRPNDRLLVWPMWNLTARGLEYVALMVQTK